MFKTTATISAAIALTLGFCLGLVVGEVEHFQAIGRGVDLQVEATYQRCKAFEASHLDERFTKRGESLGW